MKKWLAMSLIAPAMAMAQTPAAPRLTTIHTFAGSSLPAGALVEGEAGAFYGVTTFGGSLGGGTVFRVTSDGRHTVLHNFGRAPGNQTGERPRSGLVRGADGAFYGTTALGGPGDRESHGVVYRITPAGALSVIHVFREAGFSPGEIVMGPDGFLHGITLNEGAEGGGTIYRLSTDGQYTVSGSFAGDAAAGDFHPSGFGLTTALVEGSDGRWYGATGGFGEEGAVVRIAFAPDTPTNVVASATSTSGTAEGEIRLSWDAVRDANTYDVYRGTTSGSLTLMSNGSALTVTNLLVSGLTPGVTYYFAVAATNETGTSARSAEVSAIPAGLAAENFGANQPGKGGGGSLNMLVLVLLSISVARRARSRFSALPAHA